MLCGVLGLRMMCRDPDTAFQGLLCGKNRIGKGSAASLMLTGELVRLRAGWDGVFAVWEGQESPRDGGQLPPAAQAVEAESSQSLTSVIHCGSLPSSVLPVTPLHLWHLRDCSVSCLSLSFPVLLFPSLLTSPKFCYTCFSFLSSPSLQWAETHIDIPRSGPHSPVSALLPGDSCQELFLMLHKVWGELCSRPPVSAAGPAGRVQHRRFSRVVPLLHSHRPCFYLCLPGVFVLH